MEKLWQKLGWDALAISRGKELIETGQASFFDLLQVGSASYIQLLQASSLSTDEKLKLVVYTHLGAKLDSCFFLQLTGPLQLDINIPPHSVFYELVAAWVRELYQNEPYLTDPILHQLRIYFDERNIRYVRKFYKTGHKNDEEALKAYVCSELDGEKMLREPARYHNKYPVTTTFRQYYEGKKLNKKRLTPNFHSEFIIDRYGNFVSQWNILERGTNGLVISDYAYYVKKYPTKIEQIAMQKQLLNTESFNYGIKNNGEHIRLDAKPTHCYDHFIRQSAKKNQKIERKAQLNQLPNAWTSPEKIRLFKKNSSQFYWDDWHPECYSRWFVKLF